MINEQTVWIHRQPQSSGGGGGASAPIIDTRANILGQVPTAPVFAQSTDTRELFFFDGMDWLAVPFSMVVTPPAPDIGAIQDSSRIGYGTTYTDSKTLTRIVIGTAHANTDGALWYDPHAPSGAGFFARVLGAVSRFVINLTVREISNRLQYQPIGSNQWYDVARLNSLSAGINGLPSVMDGQASIGAIPTPLVVSGGNANMDASSNPPNLFGGTIFRIVVRLMTDTQRAAFGAAQMATGEIVLATDTGQFWGWNGAAWKQLS